MRPTGIKQLTDWLNAPEPAKRLDQDSDSESDGDSEENDVVYQLERDRFFGVTASSAD